MTKNDSVKRDEYHKKWAWPISRISQLTSVTGVKIQSISLITNIEIQFMNSVKIIESNFYTSFYYIEMLYHLARSMAV